MGRCGERFSSILNLGLVHSPVVLPLEMVLGSHENYVLEPVILSMFIARSARTL